MRDADFKILKYHSKGYSKFSDGKEIENIFSPDYVLSRDNDFILIEHETEPSRKTIVAVVIKAAHFLQGVRIGSLVIVMTPKRNSSMQFYPNLIFP